MKRLFLPVLVVVALARVSLGAPSLIWSNPGLVYEIPPQQAVIDAISFVNNEGSLFTFTNNISTLNGLANPYNTFDTLNFTNQGAMIFAPGLDVETFPESVGQRRMSANFVNNSLGFNSGVINCTALIPYTVPNEGVFGTELFAVPSTLTVSATNIVHSGIINMDNDGLIEFTGQHLNLTRGVIAMSSVYDPIPLGFNVLDYGYPTPGTNSLGWDPSDDLVPPIALSSPFLSVNLLPPAPQMLLTNAVPYFESLIGIQTAPNYVVWRSVFLQDSSPASVSKYVFFDNSGIGIGAGHVEWVGTYLNPVTGLLNTNYLYLSDDYLLGGSTNLQVIGSIPDNFTFVESPTPLVAFNPVAPGMAIIPLGVVSNTYSYINMELVTAYTNNVPFGLTNLMGRIQLSASSNLNLNLARISAGGYLSLQATNQFDGNRGAVIAAPYSDLNLGVTNGILTISNLLVPTVPIWTGPIQAWSSTCLLVDTNTGFAVTNDFRTLLINSQLSPTGSPLVQDLILHGTNSVTISDVITVLRTLFIDTKQLTLTTNAAGAFAGAGQLNLVSPAIVWSATLPHLQYLTNWGVITTENLVDFMGGINSLYETVSGTPYQAFVNHGIITNQGTCIAAKYFENTRGVIDENVFGDINVLAGTVLMTNGIFSATNGAVTIACNSLVVVSNNFIQAGGPVTLSPTNLLSDGYSFGNQFGHIATTNNPANVVTNGNTWLAGGEFSLLVKPTGDLLGTTVTNIDFSGAETISFWAGLDRGCSPQGFSNNLAVGRLILDGLDPYSTFTFAAVGASNAIYVDYLEFDDFATNQDVNGNMQAVNINPNMHVYYAQAMMDGFSVAEKINGKNGGGFCWVSNYAGVYSSVVLTYPNGTNYIFNQALVDSCDIASGGPDGSKTNLANCSNPTPIPTNWVFDIVSSGVRPGNNGPGGNNNSASAILALPFPAAVDASPQSVSFSGAAGAYNGLFYQTNGVESASSGYFSATTTAKGGFSAKLQLAGSSYSFSGQFNALGASTNVIPRRGSTPLTVSLLLDLTGGGQITGYVTDGQWNAALLADLAGFNSKSNPAGFAGQYTLLIPGTDGATDAPAGDGFGTVAVDKSGNVQWSGTLADGVKVSQSSTLSRTGIWPFYSSLYGGSGCLVSWIQFTNQLDSDLGGAMIWIKPGGVAGQYYPAGFTNETAAVGSLYAPPALTFTSGVAIFSGGNLALPFTNKVALQPNGKVSNQSANKLSLTTTMSSGLFNGSVVIPLTGGTLLFQGALFEKDNAGAGFFLGTNQSGQVFLGPAQ
jgi:hypothetical protein